MQGAHPSRPCQAPRGCGCCSSGVGGWGRPPHGLAPLGLAAPAKQRPGAGSCRRRSLPATLLLASQKSPQGWPAIPLQPGQRGGGVSTLAWPMRGQPGECDGEVSGACCGLCEGWRLQHRSLLPRPPCGGPPSASLLFPRPSQHLGMSGVWRTRAGAGLGAGDHPPATLGLTVLGGSVLGSSVTTCRLTPSSPAPFSWATTSACFHHLQGRPFTDTM